MKKIFIVITIILIGIIIVVFSGITKKENNTSISYVCDSTTLTADIIVLKNKYEFTYSNNELTNLLTKFVVEYKSQQEYDEAYYDSFFEQSNPVDDILKDDKNLTKTYIWYKGYSLDKDDKSLDTYLKKLEEKGYTCTKKE